MAKRKQLSPEELREINLQSDIKDMKRGVELGMIPKNPTRQFKVNDRVVLGHHEEVYIREVGEGGMYYTCEAINVKRNTNDMGHNEFHVVSWVNIYPYDTAKSDTNFAKEDRYYIRQLNSSLRSIIHLVYGSHAGVDFDAEYQREHVWKLEDKTALIDSIFNNIDIGKFLFVQLDDYTPGKYYQIIDGKQRLTAICEFFEDRFLYRGYTFSMLSYMDKYRFENHPITYGFLENPDKRGIYETFIKMNTCGKPMDVKHIENVKELLKQLK
jgi:hypothetical protein